MPRQFTLELRCKKNADRTIDGAIFDDGKLVIDPGFNVTNGTCEDIKELWRKASKRYSKNPTIAPECQDCFEGDFFENETLYPE